MDLEDPKDLLVEGIMDLEPIQVILVCISDCKPLSKCVWPIG
jgi:hypothetical protein